uniref:Uncharacterized protein n=1 Tax=Rhipicephalus microplus TaxID=6941 RepID=A0A6G5AIF8_RHIMP
MHFLVAEKMRSIKNEEENAILEVEMYDLTVIMLTQPTRFCFMLVCIRHTVLFLVFLLLYCSQYYKFLINNCDAIVWLCLWFVAVSMFANQISMSCVHVGPLYHRIYTVLLVALFTCYI